MRKKHLSHVASAEASQSFLQRRDANLILGVLISIGCAGSVLAADSVPATPASVPAAAANGDIVVTAEKRSSTVQKTPLSISVMSGADLLSRGLSNLGAVAQQIPGISSKTSGPGQTEYVMRGLTSTGGESPTVGFYLDETALTPPAMSLNGKVVVDPNLFDVARVEVLRGPQGTLYGAGSMGGTIKILTNQPDTRKFEVNGEGVASGTQGGGFNHTENLMVNVPLVSDQLAFRIVSTEKRVSGWIDRTVLDPFPIEVNDGTQRGDVANAPVAANHENANWEELRGVRASLLIKPVERLSITPSVLYQTIAQGAPNTIDSPPVNEVHYQPFDVPEPFHDRFLLADLTGKYDFDDVQLTSATSRWIRHQRQTQDISEAMQDYIGKFFGPVEDFPFEPDSAGLGLGAGSISENDHTKQFSEEVRLSSTGSGPFQWLIGGYYSNFSALSHVYSYYQGFVTQFGTSNLADNHRQLSIKQNAIFAEASYTFFSDLKATVGLRRFSYQSNSVTSVSGVSTDLPNGQTLTLNAHASNAGVTPKFNLSYMPDPNLTLYATASKGFRPGGPNSPLPVFCGTTAPTQFNPDSLWSYEAGEKARLFDQRLTINGDVYYEKWSNIQQLISTKCGYNYTQNAGSATVYGFELETSFRLSPDLTLSESVGYTHAVNDDTIPQANVAKDERLLDVPKFTSNTSLSFHHPLNDDLALIGRITNSYISSTQDITYTRNTLPSYDLVDLRFGVTNKTWSTSLFIDNVGNKKALLTDTNAISANVPIFNRIATNQPRTFGIDLSFNM